MCEINALGSIFGRLRSEMERKKQEYEKQGVSNKVNETQKEEIISVLSFNDELIDSVIENLSTDEETVERLKVLVKDSTKDTLVEQVEESITKLIETEAQKAGVTTPIISSGAAKENAVKKIKVNRIKSDPVDIKISGVGSPVMEFIKDDELDKKVTPSFNNFTNTETPEIVSVINSPSENTISVSENQLLINKYNWLAGIEKIANQLGFIIKCIEKGNYILINTFKGNMFILPKSFRINLGTIIDDRIKIIPRGDMLPEDQNMYCLFNNGTELNVDLIKSLFLGGIESLNRSSYSKKVYELNKIIDLSTFHIYGKAREQYIHIMYAAMQKNIIRKQNRFSAKLDKTKNIITLTNDRPYSDIKSVEKEDPIKYIIDISKLEIKLCK